MADVKWIKITTDIFDDEKILLIESLPDAYAIITVWFKLLCLAGKQNNSGVFLMGQIAYTDKMLATIFRMKESSVTMALQTFEQFGMIEIIDGVITIPNWNKHQSLDAYEKKKERDRLYQAERRAAQKALIGKSSDTSSDSPATQSSDVVVSDIEEDKEIDKEIEEDNFTASKDAVCRTTVQQIVDAWNSLGLSKITKIVSGKDRDRLLKARIKEYGVDLILQAIEKVRQSDFLMGKNKDGWTITFDWFIRPNNFPKVLDGNYDNKSTQTGYGRRKEQVPGWMARDTKDEMAKYVSELHNTRKTVQDDPELAARAEGLRKRLNEGV